VLYLLLALLMLGAGSVPPLWSRSFAPQASGAPAARRAVCANALSNSRVAVRSVPPALQGTSPATSWLEKRIVTENIGQGLASQVVDPIRGLAYLLVATRMSPERPQYVLERITLASRTIRQGSAFPVDSLTLAAGQLWASGQLDRNGRPTSFACVYEIDPRDLSVDRVISFQSNSVASFVSVAGGPDHSAWVGSGRVLLHVNVTSGRTLNKVAVPRGLAIDDLSIDPAEKFLYVSLAHSVGRNGSAGVEGLAVFEYNATTGQQLASVQAGPVEYSIAGAALTAVPGGVWASFRTGMMGLTILLRQSDLTAIAPPGLGPPISYPLSPVFDWPMGATTVYGGNTLFLAQEISGTVACINPQSGSIIATEVVPVTSATNDALNRLLAVDVPSHTVYGTDGQGLISFSPPSSCWTN
jgi:hypothetical protein